MTSQSSCNENGPAPKKLSLSIDLSNANLSFNSFASSQNSQSFLSNSQLETSQESADESDVDDSQNAGSSSSSQHHSRKEKSLGILCRRFLVTMGENLREGTDIHLETVATKMDTEKRRIYDIVNVMEALESMSKTNKSFYRWNTLSMLPQLMSSLKKEACRDNLPRRIKSVEDAMCSFTELGSQREAMNNALNAEKSTNFASANGHCTADMQKLGNATTLNASLRDRNGKNSLAQLCRRFLMVLLCNPGGKVSLDVASTVLIKEPESEGYDPPSRSRCRRLYDIANVLVAMGLIKKVPYLFGTKKIPLFVYCGPNPATTPTEVQASMMEFVQRSALAKPNDSTWIAIFGAPETKPFRSLENFASAQQFSNIQKPAVSKAPEPKRRVLGELDPINPIGRPLNSANIDESSKPFKKRNFDGTFKYPGPLTIKIEDKENLPNISNDENALPKPQPHNASSSSQFERKLDTLNPNVNAFPTPFINPSFPFNQLAGFQPLMSNFANYQQLCLLNLQWQLKNTFAQQNSPVNLLSTTNTAFKPVNNIQPSSTAPKPFGTSQTNR
ncbi:hypothetical protein M3Y97_00532100 [Aphelenchoides bicaudatus]|nr:hypothetical protein M3Y97_00532100 [Aphelenchoides bicaudatus]